MSFNRFISPGRPLPLPAVTHTAIPIRPNTSDEPNVWDRGKYIDIRCMYRLEVCLTPCRHTYRIIYMLVSLRQSPDRIVVRHIQWEYLNPHMELQQGKLNSTTTQLDEPYPITSFTVRFELSLTPPSSCQGCPVAVSAGTHRKARSHRRT